MPVLLSTRAQSRKTGKFVRSTHGSQSLERGLALLRAFRLGSGIMTNADLAERTSLPRPTVSRLTRSLVDAGFLVYDVGARGYRLSAVCLSLALSYRMNLTPLDLALPLMRNVAEGRKVNIGLAVADQTEMVYLDSVRLSRMSLFRRLVPGSRIPIGLTSLGRAFMSAMQPTDRKLLLARLASEFGTNWPDISTAIRKSLVQIQRTGYCWAEWQTGVVALATPLSDPDGQKYALNISLPLQQGSAEQLAMEHGELLMTLAHDIDKRWQAAWL